MSNSVDQILDALWALLRRANDPPSADPRLKILLALIENADKFPSVDPVTRAYVPMSITEAAIYTEVLAGYLETKKPPGDEEWAVHDTQPHDATDKAETANKTH